MIFNFESDPASGWLCPSESKLYMRARLKQIADNGTMTDAVPSQALRFADCLDFLIHAATRRMEQLCNSRVAILTLSHISSSGSLAVAKVKLTC